MPAVYSVPFSSVPFEASKGEVAQNEIATRPTMANPEPNPAGDAQNENEAKKDSGGTRPRL